jgi:hypothetical protein
VSAVCPAGTVLAWRRQAEPLPVVAGPEVAAEAEAARDAPRPAPEAEQTSSSAAAVVEAEAPGALSLAPAEVPAVVAPDAPWSAPAQRSSSAAAVVAEAMVSPCSAAADR